MKKVNYFLMFLLFIMAVPSISVAQMSSEKIDSMVNDALVKFKVAGACVAVVKDGKVIHSKGYGVTSVQTKQPVNELTNFQIASNSKAFTTAALAILNEQGKLKWTDRVKDFIPEFRMYNDYVTENFTIEDLLTHRSGMGLGVGDLMFFPDGSDFTVKDVVTDFQYFKPQSAFRTKFDYDNLLYIVAGEVIARVSGMSYENFVQKRIIEPLQMNHTYVGSLLTDKVNLAMPHSATTGTIRQIESYEIGIGSAAGGIFSNANDMAKWVLMHLNKGKYGENNSRLFSAQNQQQMWTIHTVLPSNQSARYNSHFAGYGLGWFLKDMKGNLYVQHTGGLPGMLSEVTMIPDLNLGIIVFTNTEQGGGGLFSAVTNTIVDSYLGLSDNAWVSKYSSSMNQNSSAADKVTQAVWKQVDSVKSVKIKYEDYAGMYEDKWFGKVEVFMKENKLWIRCLRSPKLNGPLSFYNANTFAAKWQYQAMNCDALVMFALDEKGKGQSIKMKGISPDIDFSFDFQDLDLQRVSKN